jgi:CxxC motif-containing protein (DUF1111 family)
MNRIKLALVVCFAALVSVASAGTLPSQPPQAAPPSEAPAGFDNETNGFVDQVTFNVNREIFEEIETLEDGIGPVYNGLSCVECHQNPVTGGNSQVLEMRAGRWNGFSFTEQAGGSLVHSRAIDAAAQEPVIDSSNVRTFRASTSVLGLGYVEAIDDNTLRGIAAAQPAQSGGRIRGMVIEVPVDEAPGARRVGRFGWKNQQASLLSFAADAYLNEMGITTPLAPIENTCNGDPIDAYDHVPLADPRLPDDEGIDDLEAFATFIRATKAPPRDAARASSPDAIAGEGVFDRIGCAVCHVATIVTAPPGTLVNGGTFTVPEALGNKSIHPYSDFLLHDVGTGDGIVQNGGPASRNKVRTAPLWGLRTRNRFMHDGGSLTLADAILRHREEAFLVVTRYRFLSTTERNQVIAFLKSL